MATAIESEVRSIITAEREERINRAYSQAWNDWWGNSARNKLSRWPRTRANNIFEYLTNHLIDEFAADSEARFIFHNETFKLILENRLVIRFKKANNKGVGSNIGTQAALEFCELQTDLPGMPGLQKVEIDYALNVTESAIDEIIVMARNGDKRLWRYNIAATGGAEVIPLVQPQPPVPDIDKMVVPRTTSADEKSGKGEN